MITLEDTYAADFSSGVGAALRGGDPRMFSSSEFVGSHSHTICFAPLLTDTLVVTIDDNHFGDHLGAGGDRVGFAEAKFLVPEPAGGLLAPMALLALALVQRRRRRIG